MILQSIKMAWKSICGNKMRSFLTMLGIIIGVIALVVLVSLVNSATTSVTDQISSLGNNLLSATILDTRSNPLRLSELSALLEDPQIELVAPLLSSLLRQRVEAKARRRQSTELPHPISKFRG